MRGDRRNGGRRRVGGGHDQPGVGEARPAAHGPADGLTARHRITLIAGDRVVVDAKGRVVGLERAKGRENVPVQVRKAAGHTYVVPTDVAALIAEGKIDRRLFDITALNSSRTRADQKSGLKLIVGYKGAARTAKADVREAGTLRRTLSRLVVKNGRIAYKNPAKGQGLSFHAKIADKKGNRSTISIYDAFYAK